MLLPPSETPLYNHPLHQLEHWLSDLGCTQDERMVHCWLLHRPNWDAVISLEETALQVKYSHGEQTQTLTFPYSLTRWDVEQAVFQVDPL